MTTANKKEQPSRAQPRQVSPYGRDSPSMTWAAVLVLQREKGEIGGESGLFGTRELSIASMIYALSATVISSSRERAQ